MSGEASCEPTFDELILKAKHDAWQGGYSACEKAMAPDALKATCESLCKHNTELQAELKAMAALMLTKEESAELISDLMWLSLYHPNEKTEKTIDKFKKQSEVGR